MSALAAGQGRHGTGLPDIVEPASPKPTIVLVANWPSDVGYAWWLMEFYWTRIAEHFSARGYRVLLLYPEVNRVPAAILSAPIDLVHFDVSENPIALLRLARLLRRNRARMVYLTDRASWGALYLALRAGGVDAVAMHDHTPGDRSPAHGLLRTAKSLLHRVGPFSADLYVSATEFVRQRHLTTHCIAPEATAVAQNGIEPRQELPEESALAYATFAIPSHRRIIVTTGRAHPYKRIDFVIECAHEMSVRRGHDDVHFLYFGDGPHLETLRARVEELGVTEWFTFAGRHPDVRRFLPSCYLGIQASQGEVGYSLSILEYMSAGLPTLVPNLPSTREATVDHETGYWFEPDDLQGVIRVIRELVDDEDRHARMSRAASDRALRDFPLTGAAEALVAGLSELAARKIGH